ncbi:MAG: DUF4968 domain-containing protein [Planctomycetes bacterium]|nr:DUF4968 domain-containing protein [Planctomycetota bacterium]
MPAVKQKIWPVGNLEDFQRERHIFDLNFARGLGRLSVITPSIVRMQFTLEKDWPYKPLMAIEEKEWKSVPLQIKRHSEKLDITTPKLIISLVFRPFRIRIYDHEGHLLCQDHPKCSATFRGMGITAHKKAPPSSVYTGLGDYPGPIDRAGNLYNFEMNKDSQGNEVNPQLLFPYFAYRCKDHAIGFFIDNPNKCSVDLRASHKGDFSLSSDNGNLDYYFIIGEDIDAVTRGLTLLIGNPTLPPRWTLEIMKSLETSLDNKVFLDKYNTIREEFLLTSSVLAAQPNEDTAGFGDERPLNLLNSFKRSDQIPHFMLEVDQKTAIDKLSKKSLSRLSNNGTFVESYKGKKGAVEIVDDKYVYMDPFHDAGLSYMDEHLNPLYEKNLRGVELHNPSPPWGRKSIQGAMVRCIQEIVAEDGDSIEKLIHDIDASALIGYMPNGLAKGVFSTHTKATPELRPLLVTTSGYAGIQRYSALRLLHGQFDWEDIPKYLTRILNLNISGAPLICTDIEIDKGFNEDLICRQIYALAFVPLIRLKLLKNHDLDGMLSSEKFIDALEFLFNLRESWLPYLYQLMWLAHTEGTPILYPGVYFFPEWESLPEAENIYFVGEHIMVAPYLDRENSRTIKLPQGEWADAHTYEVYSGGDVLEYNEEDTPLPMFFKEGSILPRYDTTLPGMERTISIIFFSKSDTPSEAEIYDDDGDTVKYASDLHSRVQMRLSSTKKGFVLKIARRMGRQNPSWSSYMLSFVKSRLDIQKVIYNRVELEYYMSQEELCEAKQGFFLDDEKELLLVKIPYEREGGVVRF